MINIKLNYLYQIEINETIINEKEWGQTRLEMLSTERV